MRTNLEELADKTGDENAQPKTIVVMADPQLGMVNFFNPDKSLRKNMDPEFKAFSAHVKKAAEANFHNAEFVFVAGDMVNEYPCCEKLNGLTQEENKQLYNEQAEAVFNTMKAATMPVYYTPGNHDIGDDPRPDYMKEYVEEWKANAMTGVALLSDHSDSTTAFINLNSQPMQDPTQLGPEKPFDYDATLKERAQLVTDLRAALGQVHKDATLLVMLTHIPPFMNHIGETAGWANWAQQARTDVFTAIQEELDARDMKTSIVWVCGHLHSRVTNVGNVEFPGAKGTSFKHDIHVLGAVGSPMVWDPWLEPAAETARAALLGGGLPLDKAEAVAGEKVFDAFGKFIAPKGNFPHFVAAYPGGAKEPQFTGYGVFTFDGKGGYTSQWVNAVTSSDIV